MTNDDSHDSSTFYKLKILGSGAAALSSVVGLLYQDPVTASVGVAILSALNLVEAELDYSGEE